MNAIADIIYILGVVVVFDIFLFASWGAVKIVGWFLNRGEQ